MKKGLDKSPGVWYTKYIKGNNKEEDKMNKYGYIYSGNYTNQVKYGITKIGMTQIAPSARRSNIESKSGHKFRMRRYIRIENITKEDLLFVESWVRREMARIDGLTYEENSNDHFTFMIEKGNKFNQFDNFADLAMKFAMDALVFMGYDLAKTKIKNCQ